MCPSSLDLPAGAFNRGFNRTSNTATLGPCFTLPAMLAHRATGRAGLNGDVTPTVAEQWTLRARVVEAFADVENKGLTWKSQSSFATGGAGWNLL
jgi:hypothetical protein